MTQKGEKGNSIRDVIDGRNKGLIPASPYVAVKANSSTVISESKQEQEESPQAQTVEISSETPGFSAADFVTKILSTDTKYENSRKTVLIDQGFKNILNILSQLSNVDISQILNNILREFLQFDGSCSIMPELEQYIQEQHRSIRLNFKQRQNNG